MLGFSIGVAGVALSSSVTASSSSTFKARQLAKREPAFRLRPLVRYLATRRWPRCPGALVCGALVVGGDSSRAVSFQVLATLVASSEAFGIISYLILATRLGLKEPRIMVGQIVDRIIRRRPAAGSAA